MKRNAVAASPRSSRRNYGGGGRVVNRDRKDSGTRHREQAAWRALPNKTKRIRIGRAGSPVGVVSIKKDIEEKNSFAHPMDRDARGAQSRPRGSGAAFW